MSPGWSCVTFAMLLTSAGSSVVGRFGKTVPDISIVPSGYQFKEVGSKIVFTCIIGEHLAPGVGGKVNDWPVFKWKDPNQALVLGNQNRIFSERVDAYKSKMYVTRVEDGDAGLYTCEVQTKDGLMLMASNNLFIYADINFAPSSTNVQVLLGSSALLDCEAVGNPQPDISWKFNGRKLPKDGRYEVQRNGLRIRQVRIEDSGSYECRAQVISQGNFKNLRISLHVLYAPILSLPLYSPTVVQGKDAKLDCQASGNPPVTYHWIRGNSKTGKSLYKGPLGSYVIRNVVKNHEGEYTCVVENKYGAQEGTVDLRVTVPPKVKVPEKLVSVLEGQELVLPCEADSSPLASFSWSTRQKDGKPGEKNQTLDNWTVKTSEVGVSKLRMKNVTRMDAGNYTCTATNEAGYDAKDIQVAIDFIPKVALKSPEDVYAWSGEQRVLTCLVLGHPLPTITWVKDRFTYLGSTPHHTITTAKESLDSLTTSLRLTFDEELENSLYSNYSCTAKNLHGFDTKTVSVKRAYRPELPRNLSVVNVTYDSFSLKSYEEVQESNPSIPAVSHWVVKYKKSKTSPTTLSPKLKGTEFVVTRFQAGKPMRVEGLESETEYLVLVAVGNVVGESGTVKFNVQTTKFHEDELFQADQSLMSKSSLTRQEHLRLTKHLDERQRAKSFWDNVSIGLVVVVAGLLTVVTTVVLALAARNWRRGSPAKSGRYRIGSPSKEKGQFDHRGQHVRLADDHDIDNLTMKTNRPRTSVNDDSPFADLQTRYGSLPKKFNDGTRLVRPFDVVNNNINSDNQQHHPQQQQQQQQQQQNGCEKLSWPMSSTLPRSRKMEVHVNRTASVMEMIEERKTKQSQAWKEMLKLTTADLDEDSMLSRDEDDEDDGNTNEGDNNHPEDEGVFEDGNHGNLPPPPSDMLSSPVKPLHSLMTSPQQETVCYSAPSTANVNCKQGPFDASHVDDDDDISFIDDDDEDDVIITHHSIANSANKRVHFEGKSFKQY